MNKTKAKPSTDEGWAVYFYDSDRHLRFTLEPSHIWAFCWGIGVGLVVAIVWSAFYHASHSLSTETNNSETNNSTNLEATPEMKSK